MKTIINLTPHDVRVIDEIGTIISVFLKSEKPARVSSSNRVVGEINGIPIEETIFGDVLDLPEMQEDVYYIVSRLVFNAANERADLLVPGQQVRNINGVVIGCKSLAR